MWLTILILVIVDILLSVGFILFLYFKGKDRYVPRITDEEYKEFINWYNKNKKK
jgi:hypothetical protein